MAPGRSFVQWRPKQLITRSKELEKEHKFSKQQNQRILAKKHAKKTMEKHAEKTTDKMLGTGT